MSVILWCFVMQKIRKGDLMIIKKQVRKNRIPVSIAIPYDLLNFIDSKVMELNFKSRSDLIVEILKERFKTES